MEGRKAAPPSQVQASGLVFGVGGSVFRVYVYMT